MRTSPLLLMVGLVALGSAPVLRAQSTVRYLELETRLVGQEIDSSLSAYQKARARERDARSRLAEASQALDQALSERAKDLDAIENLVRQQDRSRAEVASTADEARDRLAEILALLRRKGILDDQLARLRGAPANLPDPLTGTWRLTLEPGGRRGLLDLDLDGTVVRGTLGLADGSFGSVRGTFTDGDLRLERVAAEKGLDLIFEGRLDPATGALSGTWRPVVLGRGESAGGTWNATKAAAASQGKGATG